MVEIITANSTAAAERSFIFLMEGSIAGQIKSQTDSMAELIISKQSTMPMQSKTAIHSILFKEKITPDRITIIATTNSILKFFSCRKECFKPLNANKNDCNNLIIDFLYFRNYCIDSIASLYHFIFTDGEWRHYSHAIGSK